MEGDLVVFLVGVEDLGEAGEHGGVVGVAGGWGVGGGEEAAGEGGEVEGLGGGIGAFGHGAGGEEGCEDVVGDVFVVYGGVVGGEVLEEFFVGDEEGGGGGEAVVPDEGDGAAPPPPPHPPTEAEDAVEFFFAAGAVEPVEGLAGGDEVDAEVGEGGCFGGGVDGGEAREVAEVLFAGGAHVGVGLDAEDGVAVVEEEACEEAGAGADVGDDGVGREEAGGCEVGDDLGRVAVAEFAVVFDAVGEALGGVHGGMICGRRGAAKY